MIFNSFQYSFPISVCLPSLIFIIGRVITTLAHSFGVAHLIFVFTLRRFGLAAELMVAIWAHTSRVVRLICVLTVDNRSFVYSFGFFIHSLKLILIIITYLLLHLERSHFRYLKNVFQLWHILPYDSPVFEGKVAFQTFNGFWTIVFCCCCSKSILVWTGLLRFVLLHQHIQLLELFVLSWFAFKFL